jgi:host factor-I protein
METNLLDRMLNAYQSEQTAVTVTLQNKIRVSGKIKAFDSYVIVLESQKREILYRHAVSCLAPYALDEQKRPTPASRPKPAQAKPLAKPTKSLAQKPGQRQPQTMLSATAGESGINNSMKEGLLKWMQEQKAAK